MSKSIETLVEDVRKLFDEETHTPQRAYVEEFLKGAEEGLYKSLSSSPKSNHLRGSNIGYPDRKLWFTINNPRKHPEPNLSKIFFTGDMLEAFFVFLFREAGHTVEHLQQTVEMDGVQGHIDCVIDGVLVDIKTASWKNYQKFINRTITYDDPHGYVTQLSMYAQALGYDRAGWIPINKVTYDFEFVELLKPDWVDAKKRISFVKDMVQKDAPPEEKCFETKTAKNGNVSLSDNCVFCEHKTKCWENLRGFQYSWGTQYLTHVEKLPRVPEVPIEEEE